MAGYRARHPFADMKEPVMGIIAWTFLGLAAGLLASHLILGRRAPGLARTGFAGIAGALLGAWVAADLFHMPTLNGIGSISGWLTALIGAAIVLLTYQALTTREAQARREGLTARPAPGPRGRHGPVSIPAGVAPRSGRPRDGKRGGTAS
jgi:uncharacterized membrane protein YeaQ/YmgE (transglycosylase-associated protein family)